MWGFAGGEAVRKPPPSLPSSALEMTWKERRSSYRYIKQERSGKGPPYKCVGGLLCDTLHLHRISSAPESTPDVLGEGKRHRLTH